MDNHLIVFILYCFVAVGSAGKVTETCSQEGLICSSDNSVALCVKTPSGFQQIEVDSCSAGFHCAYTTKRCVTDAFKCHQPGVFPDPYDCHKYYVCGENENNVPEYEGEVGYCVRYYHFDVSTGKCELHTAPGECEKGPQPVPECSEFLQTGALQASDNYYYVCARASTGELYPKVYKCEDKQYYDPSRKECVQEI